MNQKHAPLIALAVLTAGCGSLGATTTAAAGPSASASAICTTRACITADAQNSLVGTVAEDESVITKAACTPSSVKHNAGDTWTVTYSDGSEWSGYANLLPAQDKVTFEPQTAIRS
jgi:hypothetical protein